MSEEKDGQKSIKVYKFNNTKESWHEFALKYRVIADDRGYDDIIEGIVTPPDEKEDLDIVDKNDAAGIKSKKEKQLARAANKKGFRDLVMSTEGISLNIVENAVSDKLTRGDLKKAWGRLETLEPQDKRKQSAILHQVLALQARECETEANGLAGIHGEEMKQASEYRTYNGR